MKSKHFKSNHALDILSMLNNDRIKMKNYCDVTLTAGSNDFAGHKCILGVFSTFLSKMFSVEMKEKYEGKGNVQGVTEETLEAVLNFIYTCDITITSENVYNLIEAANYMGIPHLKEFCVEFLLEEIDATNCLQIRSFSKLYNLDNLVEKADFVIANNFESLIKDKVFNKLKFKDIKEIFELEDKQVTSEEIVFHGMIEWIKHDVDGRKQRLIELFSLLKLENLSGSFLQDVVSQEELIMNCLECTKICFQSTIPRIKTQQNNKAIVEEQTEDKHFIAFTGQKIWKYDVIKKQKINNLPNTLFDHKGGSVASHKKKVYVISGSNTNAVEKLDLNDMESGWKQLASTNAKTGYGASVVFDDRIYNCGGEWKGRYRSHYGECYNIDENKWNKIDDMNEERCNFALVSTSGGIYAIGGYGNGRHLNSVEHHDPRQGGWNIVPSMKVAKQALAGVVLNDQIYAIGGINRSGKFAFVERFDPRNQTWCNVAEMNVARSHHGACILNKKIYVTGVGSDTVEVYDPERNIWEKVANCTEFENVRFIVDV